MRVLLTKYVAAPPLLLVIVLSQLCIGTVDAIQTASAHHRTTLANETDTGVDRSPQYVGVIECPCSSHGSEDAPLFGYLRWSDIVHDINHAVTQTGEVLSIIMCPDHYHDALHLPNMTIQRSNVVIQCGAMGEADGCTVDGATITIGENLQNVTFQGVKFVSLRHEFRIGKGSQISLIRCRFSDTIFPSAETLRSAVVSHGELTVVNSYFSGNYGGGAVHVAEHKASFSNVHFVDNTASQSEISASAIQVGDRTNGRVANVSIVDSCFENNIGTNIVYVQEGSLVVRNRDNAVLSTSDGVTSCYGISVRSSNGTTCKTFHLLNVSCHDAANKRNSVAPSAAPVTSFNKSNGSTVISSSPVTPAPSSTPIADVKETLSPSTSDRNANGDDPSIFLDLTTDDVVPLDITNDITFESSGNDLQYRKVWVVTFLTNLLALVNCY